MWLLKEPDLLRLAISQSQNAAGTSDPQFDLSVIVRLSSGKLPRKFATGIDLVDQSPELRRELALSLRGQPLSEKREPASTGIVN